MLFTDLVSKSYVTKIIATDIDFPGGWSAAGTGSSSGAIGDTYDGNTGTYYRWQKYHGGDGRATGTLIISADWTKAIHIYRVTAYATFDTYGGNYKQTNYQFKIQLKISGVWTSVYDTGFISGSQGSNSWYTFTFNQDISTGWDNVTGIKVYLFGDSYSYEGDRQQYTRLNVHEFAAYREKYIELMRVKKSSGMIQIGGWETLMSQKLRIRKGGATYAIPLLDADDPCASPVKVYNGAVVRSLPLAD